MVFFALFVCSMSGLYSKTTYAYGSCRVIGTRKQVPAPACPPTATSNAGALPLPNNRKNESTFSRYLSARNPLFGT